MLRRCVFALVLGIAPACVASACSGASSSSGTARGGGGLEVSSEAMVSSGTGPFDPDASPDGTASCHGDELAWMKILAEPLGCAKDDDCCVVTNGCLAEAQLVRADLLELAATSWPYCDSACTDCIPPAIAVSCIGGSCAAHVVKDAAGSSGLHLDHCGRGDAGALAPAGPGASHFTCGG